MHKISPVPCGGGGLGRWWVVVGEFSPFTCQSLTSQKSPMEQYGAGGFSKGRKRAASPQSKPKEKTSDPKMGKGKRCDGQREWLGASGVHGWGEMVVVLRARSPWCSSWSPPKRLGREIKSYDYDVDFHMSSSRVHGSDRDPGSRNRARNQPSAHRAYRVALARPAWSGVKKWAASVCFSWGGGWQRSASHLKRRRTTAPEGQAGWARVRTTTTRTTTARSMTATATCKPDGPLSG